MSWGFRCHSSENIQAVDNVLVCIAFQESDLLGLEANQVNDRGW